VIRLRFGLALFKAAMSSRIRVSKQRKPARSWGVIILRSKGQFLGYVEAVDVKAAELAAIKAFELNEWDRKRLLVRERA
jgi:hypothetical protein